MLLVLLPAQSVMAYLDCPQIVTQAMVQIDTACHHTQRNQACYGNFDVQVDPTDETIDLQFNHVGDIVDLMRVRAMRTAQMNPAENVWGVALLRLQASLPNTVPGQNVTLILLGDVSMHSADLHGGDAPMQAFYLTSGVRAPACAEAPPDGLLIQVPRGVGQVAFSINGVQVNVGSTLFVDSPYRGMMRITTLEGSASVEYNNVRMPVIAGTRAEYALGGNNEPINAHPVISTYSGDTSFDLNVIPYHLLDEPVTLHNGLPQTTLQQVLNHWQAEGTVCGVLDCTNIIQALGGGKCALNDDGTMPSCGATVAPTHAGSPPQNAPATGSNPTANPSPHTGGNLPGNSDFGCGRPGNACNAPGRARQGGG